MKRLRLSLVGAGIAAILSFGVVVGTVPEAQAATPRNGVCEANEFCFYYGAAQSGSLSDHNLTSLSSYGSSQPSCYDFKGSGAGKGLCIQNRAESVWNRTNYTVCVYAKTNFAGTVYQCIPPGAKTNLKGSMNNHNASHMFTTCPSPTKPGDACHKY